MKPHIKSSLKLLGAALATALLGGCAAGGVEKSYVNTTSAPPVAVVVVTNSAPPATLAVPVVVPAPPSGPGTATPVQVAAATPPAVAPVTAAPTPASVAAPLNAPATPPTASTNAASAEGELKVLDKIPPAAKAEVKMAKPVAEIVKLAQSGVDDSVILLFVDKSTEKFDLDAEEILYLNDIGVSSEVIAAMLTRDGANPELRKVLETERPNTVADGPPVAETPASPAPAPATALAVPGAPAVEVTSNYVATAPAPVPPTAPEQTVVVQQPVQQVVVQPPAVTYSYFYPSLSPYGSWLLVDGYGWCWQPTVAVSYHGWRPYCHGGRWLYTDAGWYWHSDYSWGWAPFHYGRWFSTPRHGWVWYPDYTWGPSWVTWRRGVDYCGWAPLPPHSGFHSGIGFTYFDRHVGFNFTFGLGFDHYTFVDYRRFCDRRVGRHVVPTAQSGNIYNNSTVVNNYIVGNNNTIINNGIGRDVVQQQGRTEVRKVALREPAAGPRRSVAPDRLVQEGRELAIYRPTPPPADVAKTIPSGGRNFQEVRRPSSPTATASGRPAPVTQTSVASRQPVDSWPKPAPLVRPQTPVAGRTTQEIRRDANPAAPGSSVAPRFTPNPATSVRPSAPVTSTPSRSEPSRTVVPTPSRSEPSRAVVAPSSNPSSIPSTTTPSVRPREVQRPSTQRFDPATVPGANTGRSSEPVRSVTPPATQVTPATPAPRSVAPQTAPTQTPTFSRPAPPTTSRPVTTPSTRSESIPRSQVAPSPSVPGPSQQPPVYQPRSVAPAQRAPSVSPSIPSSPPARSEPSRVSPSPAPSVSAPIQRSAPPSVSPPPSSAPAQRSSPPPQQQQSQQPGRGRVEIGR